MTTLDPQDIGTAQAEAYTSSGVAVGQLSFFLHDTQDPRLLVSGSTLTGWAGLDVHDVTK